LQTSPEKYQPAVSEILTNFLQNGTIGRAKTQNDESQDCLAGKCNKLHEVIWEIKLFIVYARED
jgi:hypothetical protein